MFFGLSHVEVPVRDLRRARALYTDVLGFSLQKEGEGFADVHGHSATIRLVQVQKVGSSVNLRVQVQSVEEAFARLRDVGLTPMYAPMRSPALELVASLQDADGHTITVWRALTEDEYGFVPELPTSARWQPDAEVLLKGLLGEVPALFRGLARRKVTRWAEDLAGPTAVDPRTVVRAYILSSAKVTRSRVRAPLEKHGWRPGDFQAEFDAD